MLAGIGQRLVLLFFASQIWESSCLNYNYFNMTYEVSCGQPEVKKRVYFRHRCKNGNSKTTLWIKNFWLCFLGHIFDVKLESICSGEFFESWAEKKIQNLFYQVKILEIIKTLIFFLFWILVLNWLKPATIFPKTYF